MVAPCLWGSAQWFILHLVSFNYPENPTPEDKQNMYAYLTSLGDILPCPECKEHYKENVLSNNSSLLQSLNSRDEFSKWMYDFHNLVNKQTNKVGGPTYEQVAKKYKALINNNSGSSNTCEESCSDEHQPYKCRVDLVPKNEIDFKTIVFSVVLFIVLSISAYLLYTK